MSSTFNENTIPSSVYFSNYVCNHPVRSRRINVLNVSTVVSSSLLPQSRDFLFLVLLTSIDAVVATSHWSL